MPNRLKGRDRTKSDPPVLQVRVKKHKKQFVTETGNVDNDTTLAGGVTAGAAMTLLGQSQREAQRPMGPMVAPKRRTTIGCWNVRTMAEATRAGQVAKEMLDYGIEVLGISEGGQRQLGEGRWRRKETRRGGRAGK